jgi:hypothetical protein
MIVGMFERARSLVLSDRQAARKALLAEMEAQSQADLDAELDELAAEERGRAEAAEAERRRAEARARASHELREARLAQHEAAARFDAAVAEMGAAFDELEELAVTVARLEAESGAGDGQRPVVNGHARSGAVVAALWNGARSVARRVGLRNVAGSSKNIRPLTGVYPKDK